MLPATRHETKSTVLITFVFRLEVPEVIGTGLALGLVVVIFADAGFATFLFLQQD